MGQKTQLKRYLYKEALEESLNDLRMDFNHIDQLRSRSGVISDDILKRELDKTLLNMELGLARYCILLRKMNENGFIAYTADQKQDINAIIHSNRFDYSPEGMFVYSQRGREEVHLQPLFELGQQVIETSQIKEEK